MRIFWLRFEMEGEINFPDLMDLTDDFSGVIQGVRVEEIALYTDRQMIAEAFAEVMGEEVGNE